MCVCHTRTQECYFDFPDCRTEVAIRFLGGGPPSSDKIHFTQPKAEGTSLRRSLHRASQESCKLQLISCPRRFKPKARPSCLVLSALPLNRPPATLHRCGRGGDSEKNLELMTREPVNLAFSLTPFPMNPWPDGPPNGNYHHH